MRGGPDGQPLPRNAVLGAGHVGPVIARVAIAAGYQVTIAASGDPERIALIAQVLAPGAEPRWAADAVDDSDVVVLAIPAHRFPAFDPASVAGKLVVDAMNYWPPVDGVRELFEDDRYGSRRSFSSGLIGRRSSRASTTSDKTRGFAIPTEESFRYEVGPQGALYVGSPETVAQKIAQNLTTLGANRFDLKYGMGGLSHQALMTNIELYGTQVIPRVRELLA